MVSKQLQWVDKCLLKQSKATHRGDTVPINAPNKAAQTMEEFRGKYQLVKLNKPFTRPDLTRCWTVYTNPAAGNKTQPNALHFLSLKKATRCLVTGEQSCVLVDKITSLWAIKLVFVFLSYDLRISSETTPGSAPCPSLFILDSWSLTPHSYGARLKQNSSAIVPTD